MTYIILKQKNNGFGKNKPPEYEKVTCLINLFPSIKFLYEKYDLIPDDVISVRFTKKSKSKFRWPNHRTAFKHIFNGTVLEFEKFCINYFKKNVWKKKDGG